MLGYKDTTPILGIEESKSVRQIVARIATGRLNEDDRRMLEHYERLKENNNIIFEWK